MWWVKWPCHGAGDAAGGSDDESWAGRLKGEEEEGATAEKGRGIEGDGNTDATGWPTGCVCLTYSAWLYAGMLSGTGNVEEAREASRVPARGKMAQDSAGGVGVLKLRTGSMMKASSHANCKPCAAVNPRPSLPLSLHRTAERCPRTRMRSPSQATLPHSIGLAADRGLQRRRLLFVAPAVCLLLAVLAHVQANARRGQAPFPGMGGGGVSSAGQQLSALAGGTVEQTLLHRSQARHARRGRDAHANHDGGRDGVMHYSADGIEA